MKNLMKLMVMLFAIVAFAACNNSTQEEKAAAPADQEQATPAEETTPADEATPAEEAPAEEAADFSAGKAVYDQACMACHAAGVAGAAKLDDKARWDATAAQGKATVYDHAINGYTGEKGAMPAKGGNATLSDDDVKAAVDYMLHEAGVTAE